MNIYILIILLIIFYSCNKDDEINPVSFNISVSTVDISSAHISWDINCSSENVYYDIILLDEIIESEISENNYPFTNLNIGKNYT